VTPPFTSLVTMLGAVSRATAAVLRGVKTSLTPQNFQNESAKIVSALSVNSEYINLPNRYVFQYLCLFLHSGDPLNIVIYFRIFRS
jgi:hypothetical protein